MEQRERQEAPIGVFDSGLGGISVLRACADLLPQEDFLYFGDSANAPYGERSLEEVRALSMAAADRLLKQGVKALVVACSTATSSAIVLLRQTHPELPIIGIEPAVKPAAQGGSGSAVLVAGHALTIREDKYQKLRGVASATWPTWSPCPVRAWPSASSRGILRTRPWTPTCGTLFRPYRDRDVEYIVLGCTTTPSSAGPSPSPWPPATIIDRQPGRRPPSSGGSSGRGWLTQRRTRPGTVTLPEQRPGKGRAEHGFVSCATRYERRCMPHEKTHIIVSLVLPRPARAGRLRHHPGATPPALPTPPTAAGLPPTSPRTPRTITQKRRPGRHQEGSKNDGKIDSKTDGKIKPLPDTLDLNSLTSGTVAASFDASSPQGRWTASCNCPSPSTTMRSSTWRTSAS
ncbi:MAG: glutamate racemase [Evtepia sp.]